MRQVIFLPDGIGAYVVEVPSLPNCRAKGKTMTEASRNVRKMIYTCLDELAAKGLPIPEASVMDIPKAEGVISYQMLLREDVIEAIRVTFPNEDLQTVLDVVSEYGKQPYENDIERVQIAVIRLSEGDVDKLLRLVSDAKRDYRDVLAWYGEKFSSYP